MRKSIYLIICCCLLCLGCQEELETTSNGSLNIFLTDEVAATRTLPDALSDELKQQFSISLLRDRKGAIITEYSGLLKDFGGNRILKIGTYRAVASYGENEILALDAPYYYGEVEEVSIEKNKVTSITIACKVANALATFEIANPVTFEKYLKDYYVEIKAGGECLTWRPGDTTHPYFKSGSSVQLALKGISIATGEECSYKLNPIEAVVAGIKYKYKLKISPSNVGLDVKTEQQQESVTINETVPETWLPAPKISSDDFGEEHILRYTETADAAQAVIAYDAFRPIQDVEFILNFVDDHLKHLNRSYVLSELSLEDKQLLETAGIVLPDLSTGATAGSVDFTGVTSGLLTHNGGQEADNTIVIKVKANNRWSEEKVYTIKTVKPIIRVGYYPGNLWTKEFTINPLTADSVKTGNFHKLEDVVYEFSTDGNNWESMPDNLQKTGLTPGTSYYVRAKYRGEVPGEAVEIKTYEAFDIPNSSLDEGYDITYPMSKNPLYTYQGGWIGTRNPLTCHANGANAFYVSKSSTLPIVDGERNVAHMMTIGWGKGNTCAFGNKKGSVINNISAGIVCVGDYVASGDIINAKAAYVRPTSMDFVYKSEPYEGDEYLVEAYLLNITDNVETVIGQASFKSGEKVDSYQEKRLIFEYDDKYQTLPISHIKIIFKAGTKEDRDHLENKFRDASLPYTWAYIIGSQFWLDSFTLNYDR